MGKAKKGRRSNLKTPRPTLRPCLEASLEDNDKCNKKFAVIRNIL